MKIKNNLIKKLLIGSVLAIVGCTSLTPIGNPLNRKEAEITYDILKEGEKEFIELEKDFYRALDSGDTNTPEFDSLQRKYHSMKAQRGKYENILEFNRNK